MRTASWVIYRNADNAVMFETFNEKTVTALNTEKYRAVPILEHLYAVNRTAASCR